MVLISWMRFCWDLTKSNLDSGEIPAPFQIRKAEAEEELKVQNMVNSAFSIDGAWADAWKSLKTNVEKNIGDCFTLHPGNCIVLTHGSRIIGASALDPDPSSENHLLTGPCILHEYRCRGLGTLVLRESLRHLHTAGLERVCGLTRDRTIAARFVYRKFGSTNEPYTGGPQIAATLAA